jgi:hypothetical protein
MWLIGVFVIALAFIWVSVDGAAAFVAFWFGIVAWSVGRITAPPPGQQSPPPSAGD